MFYESFPSINGFTKIYAAQPFYTTFRFPLRKNGELLVVWIPG